MQVKDSYCCVVYGDSISKGVVFDEDRKRYVVSHDSFGELLQKDFKGVIHTVGKFGNTTTGAVERLESHVIDKRPDIVLLEFGGNDCDFNWEEVAQNPFIDHKPKTDINVFCTLFKKIIGDLREHKITPVLMTLPPLDADRYFKWVSKNNPLYEKNILNWLETTSKIYWWHERYNAAIIQIADGLAWDEANHGYGGSSLYFTAKPAFYLLNKSEVGLYGFAVVSNLTSNLFTLGVGLG